MWRGTVSVERPVFRNFTPALRALLADLGRMALVHVSFRTRPAAANYEWHPNWQAKDLGAAGQSALKQVHPEQERLEVGVRPESAEKRISMQRLKLDVLLPIGTLLSVKDGTGLTAERCQLGDFQVNTAGFMAYNPRATQPPGLTASRRHVDIRGNGRSPAPRSSYFTGAIRC
jgi:hypothetical protein